MEYIFDYRYVWLSFLFFMYFSALVFTFSGNSPRKVTQWVIQNPKEGFALFVHNNILFWFIFASVIGMFASWILAALGFLAGFISLIVLNRKIHTHLFQLLPPPFRPD